MITHVKYILSAIAILVFMLFGYSIEFHFKKEAVKAALRELEEEHQVRLEK